MANEDFEIIRQALEGRLATVAAAIPVAWENDGFDPSKVDQWFRAQMEVTNQIPSAVGVNVQTKHEGLFLVDCFVRSQDVAAGPAAADAMAKTIRAGFPYGTVITIAGKEVRVRYTQRAGGRQDSPWYFVPVTIEWYCYI